MFLMTDYMKTLIKENYYIHLASTMCEAKDWDPGVFVHDQSINTWPKII